MNLFYIKLVYSIIRHDVSRLNDLPFNIIRWGDFDSSFYNHIIINENLNHYEEKFNKKTIFHHSKIFRNSDSICNVKLNTVSNRILPYLKQTCDSALRCNIYSISKNDLKMNYLYRSIRMIQYGYKNENNNKIDWTTFNYRTEFLNVNNGHVYGFLSFKSADQYFISLSKPLRSISFPLLPIIENHPTDSKYITLGFNQKIINELKEINNIDKQCKLKFNIINGISSPGCGLKIDHMCLLEQAVIELNFVPNFNRKIQNYLTCYSIEYDYHFTDKYLDLNKCDQSASYNYIKEIDIINEITLNQFDYKMNPKAIEISKSLFSILEFGIGKIPVVGLAYGIIKLIPTTLNLFGANLPTNLLESITRLEKKIKRRII